jgi:Rad3-related DNA helicase
LNILIEKYVNNDTKKILVFDEAHNFENTAEDNISLELRYSSLYKICAKLRLAFD